MFDHCLKLINQQHFRDMSNSAEFPSVSASTVFRVYHTPYE